jgi:CheY-like chemotaxis protein/HPt (histidine-containing phosphotransfer) domain-containing protein/two-component sensor histidine kinase
VITLDSKAFVDEAEALLAAIRGGVLVHVQDGVRPAHLKVPLDYARLLNNYATEVDDDQVKGAAEALEMWLSMLAAESEAISQTRTNSLLDQISELEKALLAYRSKVSEGAPDLAEFLDESFETLQVNKGSSSTQHPPVLQNGAIRTLEPELVTVVVEDAVVPELPYSGPPETDPEILEVFGDETESLLESIQTNLRTLSESPSDRKALWEIKKNAHTLKGAASIVGLKKLSKLAHRVEDLLDRLSERNTDSDVSLVRLLGDTADCFKALSSGRDSAGIDSRVVSLHRRLDAALNAVSQSAENIPPPAPRKPPSASTLRNTNSGASARKAGSPIVRVSLERLDELVRNVTDLVASQSSFEQRFAAFGRQLDETHNNSLRLQKAMGKLEALNTNDSSKTDAPNGDSKQIMYELAETARDATLIYTELDKVRQNLSTLNAGQRALIDEIQERLMRLRNVEFGTIANRLQRTVRVTCDEEGKDAELIIENGRLEIDTQVIDALIEPLLHLLKNAVVHGIEWPETRRMLGKSELGKITVRVGNKGSNVVISVTDDGRGIAFRPLLEKAVASNLISRVEAEQMTPDRIRELIFLPGLTTAEKLSLNAGRGVGMSIVRESVAAAGGVISIETWPQKGTTFSIRIPRPFAEGPAPEHTEISPFEVMSNELSVLIVDDSPSVRLMTSRTIAKAGWHFETATNGIDALEKLRSIRLPNLILSDIEMPRMGGYEFVAALRDDEALKNIPVIFISSRTSDREHAVAAGASEYLTKPYDERRLIELIADLAVPSESVSN